MPRFKLEYEIELKKMLKALGMDTAFNPGRANFERMAPIPPNIYIDKVKHKTFVEVNEKGTEAAAVTSVEVKKESARANFFRMTVDRPFFFAIEDRQTGSILFMGSIVDPKE